MFWAEAQLNLYNSGERVLLPCLTLRQRFCMSSGYWIDLDEEINSSVSAGIQSYAVCLHTARNTHTSKHITIHLTIELLHIIYYMQYSEATNMPFANQK